MPQNANLELVAVAGGLRQPSPEVPPVQESGRDMEALRVDGADLARTLTWVPGESTSWRFSERCKEVTELLRPALKSAANAPQARTHNDFQVLRENIHLLETELDDVCRAFTSPTKIPHVRTPSGKVAPRCLALAEKFLGQVEFVFSGQTLNAYAEGFQRVTILKAVELSLLVPALKLALLEEIAARALRLVESAASSELASPIRSLQVMRQTNWKDVLDPLILFDQVLSEDPAGAYSRMDASSRDLYRSKVVDIADRSDCTEMEVARAALDLSREALRHPDSDPRVTQRRSHVGCYLIGEGSIFLKQRVGYHPQVMERVRDFIKTHPDEIYIPGIFVLTFTVVSTAVLLLTDSRSSLEFILLATLMLLLPSSQSAVQIINYLVTAILPAGILPKIDFSEGIADDCVTLVCVPTVLIDEKRVYKMVEDLEVRFLGNQDPNLHYALVSDLPDSPEQPKEDDPLVDLCGNLIRQLNEKYSRQEAGSFLLLHRHRVYNPREQLWMGWERKRGKLMDLNNLIGGRFDSFPVKIGDVSVLNSVRYVITLDTDTELPRGTARRMVGAMAHPLNQAIVDPDNAIVVAGYGILQPRVGVSVQSTALSRLASIYSGQTGIDIYTCAVSDVYQDLYGEGTFVGKGIYEVETLHKVLDHRFPHNALLSHDLVEGAYARAGLVTDVQLIEDYPSHYSAYNRRKHRWMRGDWQITGWLRPRVPDEFGQWVRNPLSVLSQWKILDNLRRSLVEPSLFLLLIFSWLVLPGRPGMWTLAAITILFLPAIFQFLVDLGRAAVAKQPRIVVDALNTFFDASVTNLLTLAFMAHQALLSIDAVVRTMVRRFITRQRLLQWETAAQAELAGFRRTILEIYLDLTVLVAFGVFLLVYFVRRPALPAALPVLLLWAFSKPLSIWLNRPPLAPRKPVSDKDRWLLRLSAIRIWRYFAELSNEDDHWLIPDNVQGDPLRIADRISPTNLGMLLNTRQVACEFGYLTVPEFVRLTRGTLDTVASLPRFRGHLANWYDTKTLLPFSPSLVSSVDSGNLVASLWTLQQGCLDLIHQPLLRSELASGFFDHLHSLAASKAVSRHQVSKIESDVQKHDWLQRLIDIPDETLQSIRSGATTSKRPAETQWFGDQAVQRIKSLRDLVQNYTPWLSPQFAALETDSAIHLDRRPEIATLERIPKFIDSLTSRLRAARKLPNSDEPSLQATALLSLLPEARRRAVQLVEDLKSIATQAGDLATEMGFGFMLNQDRRLLSIGYDVEADRLHDACYDLLATESRIAVFTAIAKDDIPQQTWFLLGRPHALDHGRALLLSWTGTMFEYLMPALWMRIYPNTLWARAAAAAVRAQQEYVAGHRIPWGISESAGLKTDDQGNYEYFAFGVPTLAVQQQEEEAPVISPYSTFLALHIDPTGALSNLRKMFRKGWVGTYGFYESIDFRPSQRRSWFHRFEVVRSWMAHHQGMSLLSIANFLHEDVVQRWFHSHPRVQATELLLQERPASHFHPVRRNHHHHRSRSA